MMIKVCVSGARGRMGRMLTDMVIEAPDLALASALEHERHQDIGLQLSGGIAVIADAEAAMEVADVLLDFSLPDAAIQHLAIARKKIMPVVCGTTGFSANQEKQLKSAAADIALVLSYNMSRGVFVLSELTRKAAAALKDYDAEIFEIHHNQKKDSPSGTAWQLARVLEEARQNQGDQNLVYGRKAGRKPGEVGLSAARGGDVVGEHQVMFFADGEQIILTHRATSRKHFCTGAIEAVRFAARAKPGLYGMKEVFMPDGAKKK